MLTYADAHFPFFHFTILNVFYECSAVLTEFYCRALEQGYRDMPIWLHVLVREAKRVARAEEQKRIKELIRKS